MRLLIVDDEKLILQGLKHIVSQMETDFAEIDTAQSAERALALMRENAYELVLTDVSMPGMNGLALIGRAKACGLGREFAVLSGYSEFAYARQALQYGVADYLLKPVDKGELARLLSRVAANARARAAEERARAEYALRDAVYLWDAATPLNGLPEDLGLAVVYDPRGSLCARAREGMAARCFPEGQTLVLYGGPVFALFYDAKDRKDWREIAAAYPEVYLGLAEGEARTSGELCRLLRAAVRAAFAGYYRTGERLTEADCAPAEVEYAAGGSPCAGKEDVGRLLECEAALSRVLVPLTRAEEDAPQNRYARALAAYVRANYAEDLGLDGAAERVGLNPGYAGRVFKQEMGLSFSQYLNQYRVHMAIDCLKTHPDWSFERIAPAVGFREIRHFYRTFKQITGLTPGEFRDWLNEP